MGLIILGLLLGIALTACLKALEMTSRTDSYGDSRPENKQIKFSFLAKVMAFAIPLALFTTIASIAMVGTGEIAVMTRFGKVTGQELGEGLHLKNPLDKANKYDVKVLKEDADATAASKDLQDVNAKLVINYRLEAGKISEIHRTVGKEYKVKLIDPAVQEVFKASTAKYDATTLITNRAGVKTDTESLLDERLRDYGIVVTDISIVNFSFSKDFTQAIEDKQVAQQNAERAKFNLEASKTDAQAQEVQAQTLSDLYIQKLFLEKWNGVLPTVLDGGQRSILLDIIGRK